MRPDDGGAGIIKRTKSITHSAGSTFGTPSYTTPTAAAPSMGLGSRLVQAISQGGIGNFARGIVASTGAYNKSLQTTNTKLDEQVALLATINKLYKEKKISKREYQAQINAINTVTQELSSSTGGDLDTLMGVTDKRKVAMGAAETALTPFMFSPTGAVTTTAVARAALLAKKGGDLNKLGTALNKAGVVSGRALKQPKLAATVAQQTGLGAAGGGLYAGGKDNATDMDIVKGALLGGALSGAVVGGGSLLGKGLDKGVKATGRAISGGISKTETGRAFMEALKTADRKLGNDLRVYTDAIVDKADKATLTRLVGNVRKAQGISDYEWKHNAEIANLQKILSGKTMKDVNPLLKQVTDYQTLVNNAKQAGLEIPKFTGSAKAKKIYEALNKSTKKPIQDLYDNNMITKENYEKWMKDKNYTRIQREVEEHLQDSGFMSERLSVSKSITSQKLQQGDGEALNPLATFRDWHNRVYKEIEANKAVTFFTDTLLKQGDATMLRDADKVMLRQKMQQFLTDSEPGKKFAERMAKKYGKEVRKIQGQLDKLNRKGLSESLKIDRSAKGKKDAYRYKTEEYLTNLRRTSVPKNIERAVGTPSPLAGSLKTRQSIEAGVKATDVRQLMEDLVMTDSTKLAALRKQIGNRNPKLAQALDEFTAYKDELAGFNAARSGAHGEIRANADSIRTNLPTLSRINKGITEVIKVEPKIAAVVNSMDPVQLGAVGKFLAIPARVLRTGATAGNLAFTLPNYIADQLSSAIISKNAWRTHHPMSIIFGMKESLKFVANDVSGKKAFKLDDIAERYFRTEKFSPSQNLARDLPEAIREVAADFGMKTTTRYKLTNSWRKFEDVVGTTEHATRLQNYIGTYKGAISDGMTSTKAHELALSAARMNSVDFFQRGELAKGMAWMNPYLNASIQGVRTTAMAFSSRPTATTAKIAVILGMPVAASTYNNLSSPEKAMAYMNLSDYTKENNIVWVLGKDSIITIKLPPGFKSFVKPIRNLVEGEFVGERQSFMESAKNLLIDPFNPLGSNRDEMLSSIIPQPLKPAVETVTNHSFFTGDKIVGDRLSNKLAEDQVYKTTGTTYRDIAKKLGISPLLVQNFIRSTGGGLAEQFVAAADEGRKNILGQDVVVSNRGLQEQIIGRVYKTSGGEVGRRMYESFAFNDRVLNSGSAKVTEAMKAGDEGKARGIANDTNKLLEANFNAFYKKYGEFMTSEEKEMFDSIKRGTYISTKSSALQRRAK